ncbi:DUF202 domain-containing protein [bacterium]|nr:DUF202 domain-containing protein [bacterium]
MNRNESEQVDDFKPDVPESDPRVQMAAERTLLAWIRTGLALMAFGFVVARFALILQTLGLKTSSFFTIKATILGVLMVMLGVVATAGSPWHYRNYFKRIEVKGQRPFAAWSLVMFVAYATSLIGVVLAIYLLIVDIANWNVAGAIQRP